MTTASASESPGLIVDANVLIALCSKEVDKYSVADAELIRYAQSGYQFYAPGVIIAECLYALCKKLGDGSLSPASHASAVADLCTYMGMILPPPHGDRSLVSRAEQIRSGYGCSRSADGLYLALAEELAAAGKAELLTFDIGLPNQAKANAPSVSVTLLVPLAPPTMPAANPPTSSP